MHESPLAKAQTTDIIALYDKLEGMLLSALTQGDQAYELHRRAAYREKSASFAEELLMLQEELLLRADRYDLLAEHFMREADIALVYRIAS